MRRLRIRKALLAAALTALLLPARSEAAASPSFSFTLDRHSVSAGEAVSLNIKINPAAEVAGFRLRVSYDPSVLRFAGASPSAQIEPGTLQTNEEADPVCSVYVCSVGRGYAPPLSGTVLTCRFLALGNVPEGTTGICACVDETCSYSGDDMRLDTFGTLVLNLSPAAADAGPYLTALEPSEGVLEPAFSQDIRAYRLNVGSDVGSITFRADASDGAGVTVSRKTLLAAGTETAILITVKSSDGKAKTVYTVAVSRAAKNAGGASSSAPSSGKKSGKNSEAEQALAAAGKSTKKAKSTSAGFTSSSALKIASAFETQQETAAGVAAAPLTVVQSQMNTFLVGMLAAGFCIVTGILLSIWFRGKKK